MFGTKALVDLTKAIAKFSLVGAVLYLVVSQNLRLISLGFMNINPALAGAGEIIATGAVWVTHFINCCWNRCSRSAHEHNKKMKMTKKEIKDEFKDTEGRPEVKAQIRRKQREMAMGLMMDGADADVIVVNPEHFAVALSYDPSSSGAIILVVKALTTLLRVFEKKRQNTVWRYSPPRL